MFRMGRLTTVLLAVVVLSACSPEAETNLPVALATPELPIASSAPNKSSAATATPSASPSASVTPKPSPSPSPSPSSTEPANRQQSQTDVERIMPDELVIQNYDELLEILAKQEDRYEKNTLLPNERYNYKLIRYFVDLSQGLSEWEAPATNYTEHPIGKEAFADLDGDGVDEVIIVTEVNEGVRLQINDKEVLCRYMYNPAPDFAIVDIDKSDSWKEIAISDFGPSSDDTTDYFAFDGTDIISMNEGANEEMQCDPEYKEGRLNVIGGLYDYIECKSDGKIIASQRSAILQTWWYPVTYRLDADHRLRIEPGLYKVDYPVFVLKPLELYTERDINSKTFMLDAEQTARLTAHDDTEWIQVTLSDGRSGWFRVKRHNIIVTSAGDVYAADVFFYLSYAD